MRTSPFRFPAFLALAAACSLLPLGAQTAPDALALYRNGSYTESVDACLAEIAADPSRLESHVVLAWALVAAGRYEEADTWAEKGRLLSRYDPRLIEIQGEAKYYRGLNEPALRLFQEYISYAPNGSKIAPAYFFMGEIYLRLSRFRHADIAFSTAIQLEDLNVQGWIRAGYAREMAKDYRPALDAYNKALELDSSRQDAVRGRERVLEKL